MNEFSLFTIICEIHIKKTDTLRVTSDETQIQSGITFGFRLGVIDTVRDPRPRRLTKDLQPSSQSPDRVCFSSLSGTHVHDEEEQVRERP